LSDETRSLIREAARKVALGYIAAQAADRDRERRFPRAELQQLGRHGLLGILVPEEWGGAGCDHAALVAAVEEVAATDGVCSMIMASQNTLANMILLQFGSETQKRDHLLPLAQGTKLCGFALTEAKSGSDAFRMETVARREGDTYVLKGAKQFVTAASNADFVITFARTDGKKRNQEALAAFVVPTDTPGYVVGKREDTFGMRSSDTCQVTFDEMILPDSCRIGEDGSGYQIAISHLDRSRLAIGAQCVGLARAAYEVAARYALERQAFGKPIIFHQATTFRIADMALKIHAARLVCEDAARRLDAGLSCTKESSMAKLYASEVAESVTHDAMQVLGGYGYLRDFPVERLYRDARVGSIYEGTSDIQRMLIGNAIIDELRA
jgi:alkylation response protein AidB-like acyl-CoA dehydrogenase